MDHCEGNAKCINTPGTFECSCPDGYKLEYSGRSCKDINECLERGHTICQVNTTNVCILLDRIYLVIFTKLATTDQLSTPTC